MEDDDSSSSLNPIPAFSPQKVQAGVVTTTTTEDEDDDTSSRSNSTNEVVSTLRNEASSANTTTDSLIGAGDAYVGCSPTSTGLNSATDDADVEDNSSPRSGERITTSSSSSSDGCNFGNRPNSQKHGKNSNSSPDDSSETQERESSEDKPTSSFKYTRGPTSNVFPPFGRNMASSTSSVSAGNHYSSSSASLTFSSLTPNPFALARSPTSGAPSPHNNTPSLYQHDTLANSRSQPVTPKNSLPFPSEARPILRPSSLSAASVCSPGSVSTSGTQFSAVRNPFGSTNSSNSSVSSSSFLNNPFNSAFGNKQDASGSGVGKDNGLCAAREDVSTTAPFPEPSSINVGANGVLRQSKLSVHYPCTSSDNSEARYSAGKAESNSSSEVLLQQHQPSTSTISSEAVPKLSIPTPALSTDARLRDGQPCFGRSFSQPQPVLSLSTSTTNENFNFVFGSNTSLSSYNATAVGTNDSAALPNGVSSTSSSVVGGFNSISAAHQQSRDDDKTSGGIPVVHSSTEDSIFRSSRLSGETEVCFASSSTIGDRKRKLSEKASSTGEENESNVLQSSCRLFVFDGVASAWIERGQGQLRLNDKGEDSQKRRPSNQNHAHRSQHGAGIEEEEDSTQPMQSRVIVRTKGSLRLMLNTNVWSGMKVERPSEKSVRFTANDNGTIRIFVVQCSTAEADVLYAALDWRVRSLQTYEALHNSNAVVQERQQPILRANSAVSSGQGSSGAPASTTTEKHEEIDSSEFDDSEAEELKFDDDDDDSPHKKKRLEQGSAEVVSSSPTTTTNEVNDDDNNEVDIDTNEAGSSFQEGPRPTTLPSIQVDEPRSDDEED